MRFLVRKRRNAPTVIIVALVDVLIVLLIFLMVTTTFKQRPTLKLQLPESSQALKPGATTNDVPFIVSIESNGAFRAGPNADPMTLEQLQNRLQQEVAEKPQLKLNINADRNAPFYRIVNVMDVAKKLNIKSVSASTKETGKP
jgi:biopolymer transport protein ExbD